MKALRCLVLALAFVTLAMAPLWADQPNGNEIHGWQRVQQELGLSNDQLQKIKPIMDNFRQLHRVRIETLGSQIRALLTPQQQQKFEALKSTHAHGQNQPSGHPHGVRELITQLSLTPQQIAGLTKLLDATMKQARADHEQLIENLRPILNSDQLTKFQALTRRRPRSEATR